MKTLKEITCGNTVRVAKLTGDGPVKRRIMDMGITKSRFSSGRWRLWEIRWK